MARFARARRYYGNRTVYINRARGFAGRGYARARGINNRFFGISPGFLVGAAAGYLMPHNQLLDNGAVIAAVVPVRGLGIVKQGAQGYVFAHALKSLISGGIGNVPQTLGTNTVI